MEGVQTNSGTPAVKVGDWEVSWAANTRGFRCSENPPSLQEHLSDPVLMLKVEQKNKEAVGSTGNLESVCVEGSGQRAGSEDLQNCGVPLTNNMSSQSPTRVTTTSDKGSNPSHDPGIVSPEASTLLSSKAVSFLNLFSDPGSVKAEQKSSAVYGGQEGGKAFACRSMNESSAESRVHGGMKAFAALRSISGNDVMEWERVENIYDPARCAGVDTNTELQSPSHEDEGSHGSPEVGAILPQQNDSSKLQGSDLGGSPSGSANSSSQRGRQAGEEATIVFKAKYKGNMTRFKLGLSSSYADVRQEVGKRFNLAVMSFDLRYLDDDHEWIMLACGKDLLECFDTLKSSGGKHIKLKVRDCALGSSIGSTGETLD